MDHSTHPAGPTAPGPASPQELVQHLRGYEGGLPEAVRHKPGQKRLCWLSRGSRISTVARARFIGVRSRTFPRILW